VISENDPFVKIDSLTEVYIDADSCGDVIEFFNHFQLKLPETLVEAANAFIANSNVETQDVFRLELCAALSNGKEEIFNDETFRLIGNNAKSILFHNYFIKHLEETLVKE
jgi:hypothetical protein